MDTTELKCFIRDIIEEEFAPNPVELAEKWIGGKMVLHPSGDQQSKEIPLEALFKKVIGIRESLRVLEQKVNSNKTLSVDEKVTLQAYVSKAYGSLTTFNILFKDGKDKFVGAGKGSSTTEKMTLGEAKAKIGLNEY